MKKKYLFIFLFVFVVNLSANNVVPKQGNPPPYPGPRGQELKGEKVYTVQKGDTLWDICANKLNNPWDWIKVWERNPHIDNPNWIYPKDKITLDLTKPIKDAYVSKSEDRIKDKRIKGVFKFKEDKEPAKKSEETAGKPLPQSDNIYEKSTKMEISKKEVVKEKQASENILESMRFQAGFIHENNLNNYGKIVKSEDDDLITLRNFIYIDMGHNKKYKEGQQLIIFSFGKSVEHPVTYEDMGKMVNSSGTALIKNVSKNLIKAKVNNQFNDIRVGDFVVPEYPQINLSKEKI